MAERVHGNKIKCKKKFWFLSVDGINKYRRRNVGATATLFCSDASLGVTLLLLNPKIKHFG